MGQFGANTFVIEVHSSQMSEERNKRRKGKEREEKEKEKKKKKF